MWPDTRRVRATLAQAYASAGFIESLEGRRLLSAAAADPSSCTEWQLIGRDGEQRGTATLVQGILHVVTTAGGEDIEIGTAEAAGQIFVNVWGNSGTANDYSLVRSVLVDRDRVSGIVIDAGDGNDGIYFFNHKGLFDLPVTMNGGAGDDELWGEGDRQVLDEVVAFRDQQTTYAHVVLNGGDGNDYLVAGIGDTTLIGGAGDDTIFAAASYDTWGHNTVIDDPPSPPPPAANGPQLVAPAPVAPQLAAHAPLATPDPHPASQGPAIVIPPAASNPFGSTPITADDSSASVLHPRSDDPWNA